MKKLVVVFGFVMLMVPNLTEACTGLGDGCVLDSSCCSGSYCKWSGFAFECTCDEDKEECAGSCYNDNNCQSGYKFVCDNGNPVCEAQCENECLFGKCIDDMTYASCGNYDSDPCSEYGGYQGCWCYLDQCHSSPPCDDECQHSGDEKCVNSNTLEECGNWDSDDCLEWGNNQSCDCYNNQCITCNDKCDSGDEGCNSSGTSRWSCSFSNDDGCYYKKYYACDSDEVCVNGDCISDCTNDCSTSGQKQCFNDNTELLTCGNWDSDPCFEWGDGISCMCCNGSCQNCSDQCSPSEKGCSEDGTEKWTCQYDTFTCCYKRVYTSCDSGDVCNSGTCESGCTNQCTPFASGSYCDGDYSKECYLSGGCYVETGVSCSYGCNQVTGLCNSQPSCTDECDNKDDTGCEFWGDRRWVCEFNQDTGCFEREYFDCHPDDDCFAGVCKPPCDDECSPNEIGCNVLGTQRWTCEHNSATLCYEIEYYSCDTLFSCENGVCKENCTDDCTLENATKCSSNSLSVEICSDHDSDDCLEWGGYMSCPCYGGACKTCIDECSVNDIGCSDNDVSWYCWFSELTGCWEQVDVNCNTGKICESGLCVDDCSPTKAKKSCNSKQLVWLNGCNIVSSVIQDCGVLTQICSDDYEAIWSDGFCSNTDLECKYGIEEDCECGCLSGKCVECCIENWECSDWSNCDNGMQYRQCDDLNSCGTVVEKPSEEKSCFQSLCKLEKAYWSTSGPIQDGDSVSLTIETSGDCQEYGLDIAIIEYDSWLPDDFTLGICAYVDESNVTVITWDAIFWLDEYGWDLGTFFEIPFEGGIAEYYAKVTIHPLDQSVESDLLHVVPNDFVAGKIVDYLEASPLVNLSECIGYGLDNMNEECLMLWFMVGFYPQKFVVDYVMENEDVKMTLSIAACKGAEYGWMICVYGAAETAGWSCVAGVVATVVGFLCDVIYLPEETLILDLLVLPSAPVGALAYTVKTVRALKILTVLDKYILKYIDDGWMLIKKSVTDEGAIAKIVSDSGVVKYVTVTFKEGVENARNVLIRVLDGYMDYVGGKKYAEWSLDTGILVHNFHEVGKDSLERFFSFFKNGDFVDAYDDLVKIADDLDVDHGVKMIELVENTPYLGANKNGIIELNIKVIGFSDEIADTIIVKRVLKHEGVHGIFNNVMKKYDLTEIHPSNIYMGKVYDNPAEEFFIDSIYIGRGSSPQVAEFVDVLPDVYEGVYNANKYNWNEWFKASGVWSEPRTTAIVRYHAAAKEYGMYGFKESIETNLRNSFASGTPQSVIDKSIKKLSDMSDELIADKQFLVDNLEPFSKGQLDEQVTNQVESLISDKYKIYVKKGTQNVYIPTPIGVCAEDQVKCLGNGLWLFGDCGDILTSFGSCADNEYCDDDMCVPIDGDPFELTANVENYKLLISDCNVKVRWLVFANDEDAIEGCYVDFGDSNTITECHYNNIAPGSYIVEVEHNYDVSGEYEIKTVLYDQQGRAHSGIDLAIINNCHTSQMFVLEEDYDVIYGECLVKAIWAISPGNEKIVDCKVDFGDGKLNSGCQFDNILSNWIVVVSSSEYEYDGEYNVRMEIEMSNGQVFTAEEKIMIDDCSIPVSESYTVSNNCQFNSSGKLWNLLIVLSMLVGMLIWRRV